jgi:hypothetical protein
MAQYNRPLTPEQQIERMTRAKHHKCEIVRVKDRKLSHVKYIAALCSDAHMWAPGSVGR